jgi:hypothetical protein
VRWAEICLIILSYGMKSPRLDTTWDYEAYKYLINTQDKRRVKNLGYILILFADTKLQIGGVLLRDHTLISSI